MQPMTRRPKASAIIALVSLPIFIGALDLTVVSAVLPRVIYDLEIPLQTGLDEAAWLVSGYLLAYTIALTFMGRLSDLYGRRRVFLLALSFFALGSWLVAVGEGWPTQMVLRVYYYFFEGRPDPAFISLQVLIAARMIQAFGGGAMVPVGMALASDLYPAAQRAKAIGVIAAVDTAGWVVGHLYGGIVVRYFDWHIIFWLNLPVCLVAFVLIVLSLRGLEPSHGKGQMDWLGALLISLGLAALNLGLGSNLEGGNSFKLQSQAEWFQSALPFLLATVLLMGLFIAWQARLARSGQPLVPLRLFGLPNFSAAGLANFLVGVGLFIAIANVPFFINTLVASTLEQGAWDSGWMLSALTVPMALASIPGGWLTVRFSYRVPATLGLAGAITGFALMSRWQATTLYAAMIPHLILAGIGLGLTIAPIAAAAINAAPEAYRGTASALVIVSRLIGMTVGVSGVTTYGVQRANYLSKQLITTTNLAEAARVGLAITETVIHETFWIAAGVCALALIPILWLKMHSTERSAT